MFDYDCAKNYKHSTLLWIYIFEITNLANLNIAVIPTF